MNNHAILLQGASDLSPDPQDPATFERSKLTRGLAGGGRHRTLLAFYTELIRLRKTTPALSNLSKETMEVRAWEKDGALLARRWYQESAALCVFSFSSVPVSVHAEIPRGRWVTMLDSADARWDGPGSAMPAEIESDGAATLSLRPWSFVLFSRTGASPAISRR